jgi:hypothetical protein
LSNRNTNDKTPLRKQNKLLTIQAGRTTTNTTDDDDEEEEEEEEAVVVVLVVSFILQSGFRSVL